MIYLNDVLYEWLSTTFPNTKWRMGDQVSSPPMPQSVGSFGFYKITALKNLTVKAHEDTYNATTDKIDRDLKKNYEARVSIDVYGQDVTNDNTSASIIASKIDAYLQSESVKDYFFTHDVGLLRVDQLQNFSMIESGQVRNRWHLEVYFSIQLKFETELNYINEIPINYNISS